MVFYLICRISVYCDWYFIIVILWWCRVKYRIMVIDPIFIIFNHIGFKIVFPNEAQPFFLESM